jgi:hypothetical protein
MTKLLEDAPDTEDFYFCQARILYKLERFPEVIEIINQYVKHFGGKDIHDLMPGTDDQELIDLFNKSNEELMKKKEDVQDNFQSAISNPIQNSPEMTTTQKIWNVLTILFPNFLTLNNFHSLLTDNSVKIRIIKNYCENTFNWTPSYEQIKNAILTQTTIPSELNYVQSKQNKLEKEFLFQIYHITHLDNLEKILELGLMSHDLVISKNPHRISSESIMEMRRSKITSSGKSLSYYANFYFNPRNKMLYRIKKEQKKQDQHRNIIVIEFLVNIFTDGIMISDGNAASNSKIEPANYYNDILAIINYSKNIRYWTKKPDDARRVCAECLIPELVPADKIQIIHVQDDEIKEKIKKILDSNKISTIRSNRIAIIVNPDMFFPE